MSVTVRIIVLGAIGLAALGGWLAVALGFVPSPMAETVVRFRAGSVSLTRGNLRGQVRDDLAEVLSAVGVANAFICVNRGRRVTFSRTIPSELHQRLRNVLLN